MLNLYIGQKQEWMNKNGCKDIIFLWTKKYNLGDMIETTKKQLLVAAVNWRIRNTNGLDLIKLLAARLMQPQFCWNHTKTRITKLNNCYNLPKLLGVIYKFIYIQIYGYNDMAPQCNYYILNLFLLYNHCRYLAKILLAHLCTMFVKLHQY